MFAIANMMHFIRNLWESFKIYLHVKFHMPNSTGPLITVIKQETKDTCRCHVVAELFYSLQIKK
jgi:hypothetical protein